MNTKISEIQCLAAKHMPIQYQIIANNYAYISVLDLGINLQQFWKYDSTKLKKKKTHNITKIRVQRREKVVFNSRVPIQFLLLSESIKQFFLAVPDPNANVETVHSICTVYAVCTLYNVNCNPYSVQCILYTTLYTVHFTLYSVHCTLYTVHCTIYTVHCTLYTVHKLYSVTPNMRGSER